MKAAPPPPPQLLVAGWRLGRSHARAGRVPATSYRELQTIKSHLRLKAYVGLVASA